jgi:hypothetical protein
MWVTTVVDTVWDMLAGARYVLPAIGSPTGLAFSTRTLHDYTALERLQ